ncbi:MAG: hypothetical protein LM554_00320 [Desulfurococcaceae archaeon]|nr:hypothetical protein [Desulfurococcaceae archaeon]
MPVTISFNSLIRLEISLNTVKASARSFAATEPLLQGGHGRVTTSNVYR